MRKQGAMERKSRKQKGPERDSAQQISKVEFRMSETKTYPAAPVILKMLQRNSTISEGQRVAATEKQPRILDLASLD